MSRLYDTVEPAVVDEDMLQRAVEEQGPKDEAGKIAKQEGIDFADVTSLRLDFKNILKVDNLWCFTSLTKLQLDNNIIERIEGLDLLVNLVWLDLSFNNIEVIEGMDKLTKLEDVTLYNNRIQRMENLDCLTNLHVFSIGNNELSKLDNVTYLRRFRQLETVNLSGNPICEQDDYKEYVVAHLPSLKYLDYKLVDGTSRQAACEKHEISIMELQQDERQVDRKLTDEASREQTEKLHRGAYVEALNGPQLFEGMYAEDVEGQKLNAMPGMDELLVVYRESFATICQQIFDFGLKRHEERENEKSMFFECIRDAKEDNKKQGTEKIQEFMDYKTQLFLELNNISDQKLLEMRIAEYNQRVSELWDALMTLEMQLVDQLEDAIKDFERSLSDMVATFVETIQGHFSQCRELENQHHERVLEIATMTLEKVVKNELDDEIPDDLRELFVDKDTIINAITASHDVHLLKIDNREDDMISQINQWMSNIMDDTHQTEEIQRNRARVTEVNNLTDHLRDEMENLDLHN